MPVKYMLVAREACPSFLPSTVTATVLRSHQRPQGHIVSKVNMVLNVHTEKPQGLLGTGRRGGGGYGGGGRGRLYTYRYTVTTRMIPALRWAAMRAILMFQ